MIHSFLTSSKGFGLFKTQTQLFLRSYHKNVQWGKPEVGWIKLNIDGSSKIGTEKASIGGAYRNHEGDFLLGFAQRIGKATSSVAELVAAKRGLELALENDWLKIWLEGDAKVVIDLLMKGLVLKSKKDREQVKEIKMIIPQLKEFRATHIYRKGNTVADRLAKMGHKMAKPQVWRDIPPDEVIQFLHRDAGTKMQHHR